VTEPQPRPHDGTASRSNDLNGALLGICVRMSSPVLPHRIVLVATRYLLGSSHYVGPTTIDAVIVMSSVGICSGMMHESRAVFQVSISSVISSLPCCVLSMRNGCGSMPGISGISRRAGKGHVSAVCVSLSLASHSAVFDCTRTLADA
jgi:hypothetical protein